MITLIRSLVFNVLFYLNLIGQLLVFSPVFFWISEDAAWRIAKRWARSSLWLLHHVAGVRSHVTGLENVPPGMSIIASKHQSFWDVIVLVLHVQRPTFILKKELMSIPVFGAYAKRMGMIPVDRSRRGGAIASMLDGASASVARGRQIVIFPEGTRTAPGAKVDYRPGVFRLYETLNAPVVPVALNSGVHWPRRTIRRFPGTIRAEFLQPIAPGLSREDFLQMLQETVEQRSRALLPKPGSRAGDGGKQASRTREA